MIPHLNSIRNISASKNSGCINNAIILFSHCHSTFKCRKHLKYLHFFAGNTSVTG